MKQLIILLLLLFPHLVKAQQQDELDSLRMALHNAASDTVRMDIYYQLSAYYDNINTDSSEYYLKQNLSIAQQLKFKLDEAVALQSLSGKFTSSNYPRAFELLLQALKINEDPESEKNVFNLPAGVTPHSNRLNALGWTHYNLGNLYGNTGNTEKQISSLLQARNLAASVHDSGLNMLSNLRLGDVYFSKLKKPDSALYFEQRAKELFKNPANNAGKNNGWVFNTIGKIYLEKGNFTLSLDAFESGLQLMQKHNNLSGIGGLCLSLSSFYNKINKPDSSLIYAYKALENYKIFKDINGTANAYSSLSSAYGNQKRIDSSFAYLKLATALHDSLNNAERKNLLVYQNKNFDEQMRLRNLEEEKIQTQAKIRTYAMLAGIAVFMAITFLLYRNNRNRRKANLLLKKQKEEIAKQKDNVEQTLIELKSTQAQLIQSEKMASLGELTAGIAHEIQNPLNFVNNFSEVNKEMIEEMQTELKSGNVDEAINISNDIKDNEEKINHHGKRADIIVKGMLQHSRQTKGMKEPTDINALCDEYLRLSYHGLRAKDKNFNAEFKTDFDESIGKINIVPQDIGRVLLNLFNNAFYAVNEKKKTATDIYKPLVFLQTKRLNDKIEIVVKDTGNGIPQNIIDKIFQPFFTTKPTGQGTGLGLSLAYDIIKAHGGELRAEMKDEEGAKFIISLPITA